MQSFRGGWLVAGKNCESRWRDFKSILFKNIVNELIKVRSLALRGSCRRECGGIFRKEAKYSNGLAMGNVMRAKSSKTKKQQF